MLKCHHHLLGKADIISFIRNVFPVEPGGHGKLIVVYSQSVVDIQITEEAKQKCSGEGDNISLTKEMMMALSMEKPEVSLA